MWGVVVRVRPGHGSIQAPTTDTHDPETGVIHRSTGHGQVTTFPLYYRGFEASTTASCRWSSRPSPWARPSSRPPSRSRVPSRASFRGLDDAVARPSLPLLDHQRPPVGRAGRAPGQGRRDPSLWVDRLRGLDDAVARPSLPLLDQQRPPSLVEQAEPLGEAVVETHRFGLDRLRGLDDADARPSLPLLDQQRPPRWSSRPSPWARSSRPIALGRSARGLDDADARPSLPLLDQPRPPSLVEQAEPLGEAVETHRFGQIGSEVSTTRTLVPRSRCSTNQDPPLVEQAEPLGEAVVETPQASTRTRRDLSCLAPAARPTSACRLSGQGSSSSRSGRSGR